MRTSKREWKSVRLFQNDLLESLTHVHPYTPFWTFGTLGLVSLFWGITHTETSLFLIVGYFFSGVLTWSLVEYLLHRLIFHFEGKSAFSKKISFLIHGIHHDHPNEADRLVAPPLLAVPFAVPIFLLFRAIIPASIIWFFIPGLIAGYLVYEWTHFSVHHRIPKTKVGKFLREYHLRHHHESSETRYGVSSPLWDFVFRTYQPVPKRKS